MTVHLDKHTKIHWVVHLKAAQFHCLNYFNKAVEKGSLPCEKPKKQAPL